MADAPLAGPGSARSSATGLAGAAAPGAAIAERDRDALPGLEPDRKVTDWGRSERVTALADATVVGFLYHHWFRVEVEGIENVPARGGALLVANRAGRLPADAAMIVKAVRDEHRAPRIVHVAAPQTLAGLPGLGMAVTKLGGVSSHAANLQRLLFDERELVLLFPEGERAAVKPLRWRYRLRSFDAIPFVETALRARAPIVPVAVLGGEEAMPRFGTLAALRGRARLPLGTVLPLPAKFRLRFLEPIVTGELSEDASREPAFVEELGRDIRALIQENLLELVAQRRSVWLG